MSILKLKPACKDYIWGGRKLIEEFGKEYTGTRLAETWELSCHPDGPSRIASGPFSGETLPQYIERRGRGILGRNCRRFCDFPILVKLIDAYDNLSIQVHPDNGYALRHEGQYGKTEMWYIVGCEPGASLYYGFSREVSEQEFRRRIEENTLTEVLNRVEVQKGDVVFIESGTIHAIGKGIVIAEIQQNSNVTYRVSDYGRLGADGKPRQLHIEEALRVTKRSPVHRTGSSMPHIAKCDYFTVDKLHLDGRMMQSVNGYVTDNSFISLLVLSGSGTVHCGRENESFQKGDSLFFEAGSGEYQIEGACEALVISIGEKASPVRIAIDMSSICVRLGLFDVRQICMAETKLLFDHEAAPEEMIRRIGDALLDLLARSDIPLDHCIGIGVGVPGVIDRVRGEILYSNNIRWENVPFAGLLQKKLPLPVYMQNDAVCMALGESAAGVARGIDKAVFLNIGNGVGSAVLYHGECMEDVVLGHMVVRVGGRACSCGRQGCLEAYISRKAFCRQAAEAMGEHPESLLHTLCRLGPPDPDAVWEAAKQGDLVARGLVGRYVRYLGEGIANIANIFHPDCIVLGGMAAKYSDMLQKPVEDYIAKECFGGTQAHIPEIAFGILGEQAGLIGAANLI